MIYAPTQIEPKWQKNWFSSTAFKATVNKEKEPYYVLEMLPYPSGHLHMGHVRNYTLGDVLARYKRAAGFNVLHPMGWDSFGLPAENAALKRKIHPESWTLNNIEEMKRTMKQFGWSYDWSREIASCLPSYYQHQQALFVDMMTLEKGGKPVVYRKESIVNWDPIENTVLANEQVVDGKGWRSGAAVERRTMHQWHFRITAYAQELLDDLGQLEGWPDRVKHMQRNWIGRSEGLKFSFKLKDSTETLPVYTTRPDTIYGVSFCAVAPEHPLAQKCAKNSPKAAKFIEDCSALGTSEEAIERAEKKGFDTGYKAIHPLTGAELPIYIANFVLMSYGTGAVMAVPAHDERDNAFATKYNLSINVVERNQKTGEPTGLNSYSEDDILENSGDYTGMGAIAAKEAITLWFEQNTDGERTTNYRLRDWGISRQRYWGCPIPIIHCDSCGAVPVPKEMLPVKLPTDVSFEGVGNPLEAHPTWKNAPCPTCNKPAMRETDTMDTFVDSSWYFLRYMCPTLENAPLDKAEADYWWQQTKGTHQYIGGIEHAVLHLLYARFFTKALRDLGYVTANEPFNALLCQGMVIGNSYLKEDGQGNKTYLYPSQIEIRDGKAYEKETNALVKILPMEKISKSKNNGDAPDALVEKYGADTLRLYMLFTAPPERDLEWSETAIEGAWRYLNRVWTLAEDVKGVEPTLPNFDDISEKIEREALRKVHQTIKKVTADIEKFHYNTMVAACMELTNTLQPLKTEGNQGAIKAYGVRTLLQLLNPACPHITEELWENLGHTTNLAQTDWPKFDVTIAKDEEITLVVQLNGKTKSKLQAAADIDEKTALSLAKENLSNQLNGLTLRKEIYIPGRLVNIVAN